MGSAQAGPKIAAILSTYDDLIENNNRRIKLLEEMVQRIYREWFVSFRYPGRQDVSLVESRLGPIPQGWEWKQLHELAEESRVGVDPGSNATYRKLIFSCGACRSGGSAWWPA